MKKSPYNQNSPLRVRAETLRQLGRTELAAIAGGMTVSGGHVTNRADGAAIADGVSNHERPTTVTESQ